METAVRWSPSSTLDDQRFLYVDIPGKSFNLCKVTSRDDVLGTLKYDVLSSRHSVPPFRAFDWSSADENLAVVGQSSGEAAVLRLDDDTQSPVVFPIRNQRSCNAVAFNTQGLLAAGLDKVRNDFSLNIWNVNQRLSLGSSARPFGSSRYPTEPLRKLASSEPITSIKFFKDHPETLVVGVRGQSVRIYDLRESSGSPSLQFITRCVHNIAIDWLDENYIAACFPSNDVAISIWDRRSGFRYPTAAGAASASADSGPLSTALDLKPNIESNSTISSLRFCRSKRGCLGMLTTTGTFRCYDIAKEYLSEENKLSLEHALGQDSSKHYPEQIYTRKVQDFRPSILPSGGAAKKDWQRVTSFDFLNKGMVSQPVAITLLADKTVSLFTPPPPPSSTDLSSKCSLSIRGPVCSDSSPMVLSPSSDLGITASQINFGKTPSNIIPSEKEHGNQSTSDHPIGETDEANHEKQESLFPADDTPSFDDALSWLTIPRLRCAEGYLLDSEKNKAIVSENHSLQELWDWIGRAHSRSKNDSMIIHGIDMNYVGVYSVWNGKLGRSFESRRDSSELAEERSISQLFQELVHKLNFAQSKTCQSEFPEKRQLCLHICGAPESNDDLVNTVNKLVADRQHSKAAALAIFQDEVKLAYKALRENKPSQAHKLLAMAIIGGSKGDAGPDWEETCAEIAAELTDPYARAILAMVGNSDWMSVLQEATLPLRYRVEVALRWLPDAELTSYLRDASVQAIHQGDVEGVLLTGLDHAALDLFQSYINKFNDVQTPVLAMCHTVPRFIRDAPSKARFEAWRETYRHQMNSWKLHLNRVKFDIESRKLAITWESRRLVEPPLQQISLVCNYCTRPLTQQDTSNSEVAATPTEYSHATPGNPLGHASMNGTACPKCNRHMPRCGICSLWLGTPDPMSKASIAEDSKKPASTTQSHEDIMRRFVAFCVNCNHGFHADHARDWFNKRKICPVAECGCICDR
ncbi:Ubiquitin-protein ligase E3 [Trichophyton interdigitale]|uniref:Ubiquitin-protein ligase E3 n=1 Tax=Trichophyton interdigitale TaxID=101480 RepID=A0A9P4YJ69_9EURO|nr:Ubiquitin-protein ligase E3 [Trichophyton interdigitale]KAF3899589.1 Ubiquitin-protein ligase E3 [Trichophyton interdigitale]KAG8209884.1 Ubiquitin-protein ligase E3 [Trichophyton interdigitale]